jgi:hypothetical protein
MRSVPVSRRVSAVLALLAFVAVLVVTVVALLRHPLPLLVALVLLNLGIAAAAYALTRTGVRRTVAAVVAVAALAAPLMLVVWYGRLWSLLLLIGLVMAAGGATRHALGRDIKSLKSGPTPGVAVGPATRPVLLMNPKSGGGKVERFNLVEEARRRGIEPIVLAPGDDLLQLARQAVAGGADVIGWPAGTAPRPWSPAWPQGTTSASSASPPGPATTWPWTWGWTATTWSGPSTPSGRRWSGAWTWA